jgi:cell division protein FtsL
MHSLTRRTETKSSFTKRQAAGLGKTAGFARHVSERYIEMKIGWIVILIIVLSSTFLFYVWGKVDVVRVGYELEELSKKKIALEQKHDLLQITYSQLTAPDRIAKEATTKLLMKQPDPGQVILVLDDRWQRLQISEPLRVARSFNSIRIRE